jgi:hypothetical protein
MHAAHLRHALDIVRDSIIRPSAINDKTLLVDGDFKVVWVSPFVWEMGSRYGCVQWTFELKDLLRNCNVYWVEVVKYRYPACRFLITRNKYKDHELLRKYDPTEKEGPWWYDPETRTHYQNCEDACVEFMIEESLFIEDSVKMEFVKHSHKYCCINRTNTSSCPEFNALPEFVGARLVGHIIGNKLDTSDLRLRAKEGHQVSASPPLRESWKALRDRIWRTNGDFVNAVTPDHLSAKALARSILSAFGMSNYDERKALTLLFHSGAEAAQACRALIQEEFGLTVELPLEENE